MWGFFSNLDFYIGRGEMRSVELYVVYLLDMQFKGKGVGFSGVRNIRVSKPSNLFHVAFSIRNLTTMW